MSMRDRTCDACDHVNALHYGYRAPDDKRWRCAGSVACNCGYTYGAKWAVSHTPDYLSKLEQIVLWREDGRTLKEIAAAHGRSQERIRQMEAQAYELRRRDERRAERRGGGSPLIFRDKA